MLDALVASSVTGPVLDYTVTIGAGHIAPSGNAHVDVKRRDTFALLPGMNPVQVPEHFMAVHIETVSHVSISHALFSVEHFLIDLLRHRSLWILHLLITIDPGMLISLSSSSLISLPI